MIGLCGAHRTGKTTLATEFGREQSIPVLQTSTSQVFKALNLNPAADLPIMERLAVQHVILNEITKQYEAAAAKSKVWVTDRTPIDLAAYMLADVTRANCEDPGISEGVVDYVQKCIDTANRFFGVLVLVQPGIAPTEAEGKALPIAAFQEHMNQLCFGLLMDDRLLQRHFFIKRSTIDLEERKMSLFKAVAGSIESWQQTMAASQMVAH